MTKFSSPVPVGCRHTSPYGPRWGSFHAGDDYAPPRAGTPGLPISAVADGIVIATGRGNGTQWARVPYHSGRYVLIDMGVIGGDRMYFYAGHLQTILVKPGTKVRAGQQIGVMGGSGARTDHDFGIHGHFGVARGTDRPVLNVQGRPGEGWIDFRRWMSSKGVTVGRTAPVKPGVIAAVKTVAAKAKAKTKPRHVRDEASIRSILIRAGHITSKNSTALGIQRYQHRQLAPFTLVHDGHWGRVTEAHYQWTRQLQAAMNRWKSDGPKLRLDGDYRKLTRDRVEHLQQRNRGGAYKGKVDGIPGPVFCAMLGIPAHP